MIAAVEKPEGSQPQCKRCGTCCRNGGPALHKEDLPLLGDSGIPLAHLVTIRAGEPAFDQLSSKVRTDRGEFVKINGAAGRWCCCFWNELESSCRIYKFRPLECRLLFCENTKALEEVMGRDLLSREDIIGSNHAVVESMRHHDAACDYGLINELVSAYSDDKLDEINRLVQYDLQVRAELFSQHPALQSLDLFLFGRPIFLVLGPYGFRPVETLNSLTVEYVGNQQNVNRAKSA